MSASTTAAPASANACAVAQPDAGTRAGDKGDLAREIIR